MDQTVSRTLTIPVLTLSRCDRWQACQRLRELQVTCQCADDGYLEVEIQHPTDILQLRSVIQQLTAQKSELVDWLHQCWYVRDSSTPDN